jgi:aromatic ring-opening dioxygenase catalytic subunit (LigB family)
MAEIVGAIGVPHNPFTALALARGDGGMEESRRLYGELASHLRAMEPDTIVIVTTDHYNLFFEVSVPIFSIGIAERAQGPCDYPMLPAMDVAIDGELAREIQFSVVADEFDVGATREPELDHTITAPLGSMLGAVEVPLVPLWVSGSMRPLPTARRCFALGGAIRRAIERSALDRRVAVVGSGAFSFEVGGPRMSEDSHVGVPDVRWALRVTELLRAGEFERVVAETTPAQLEAAGNASGEILDWLVMLGTIDPAPAAFIEAQPAEGHAFAAWRTGA